MKRYLTIFVLLCIVSTAHGAHFSYYAGGLRAFYDVYARQDYPYLVDDPPNKTQDGINSAYVEWTADVPQAYSHAYNYILSKTGNNSIFIKSYSKADGAADYSWCETSGWGYGRTQNYQTYGIFYKIMPDANEQAGDDVIVYYNDTANILASGTTFLYIGGPGTMDHIAITRGQLPPVVTEPVRENEVLRFPNVEVSNSSGDTYLFSGVHAFPAQIGDVIGIFAENKTKVEGWGPLVGNIKSAFTMILTVRPVLSGDSDYDGDVDLFDLAKLANNWLEGVGGAEPPPDTTPPQPDPVLWASVPKEIHCGSGQYDYCATMTADIATDPSGGVQYYFECTKESGFSSGWISDPTYTVLVGQSGQAQTFRVKARDIHGNVSIYWSTELSMNP